ncbi:MAG: hypothetical protein RL226_2379, partial [Bacteroidota bacterium]
MQGSCRDKGDFLRKLLPLLKTMIMSQVMENATRLSSQEAMDLENRHGAH